MGFGPHRFLWKAIWKLDTIPKIRVFTWRVGHEILPTNVEIASIGRGFGQECPRCGAEYETLIHALKDSPTSRAILSTGGLENSTISKEYNCCIDWLEDLMRVLDKRAMADLMTTSRDEDGFVLGGGGGFKDEMMSVDEAESLTLKPCQQSEESTYGCHGHWCADQGKHKSLC
ncbi:hypothetical protein Goklo_027888 [Gossypium klotzschianum]|uniref:Reverse transcriptase zinc-binding domain-containing protein n=1 Tax=Gossypium klotzschianum TaxID=34286 RepID=A0A7J8TZH9_9ROSI|nr:hypothetical protein [Gossypium klotzschianum]